MLLWAGVLLIAVAEGTAEPAIKARLKVSLPRPALRFTNAATAQLRSLL
jgi:hypothetical protein